MDPRYVVPFHPKSTPHFFTDLLVIGGGLAGLRAAVAAGDDQRVLVVTKEALRESSSSYAQGGIAGVLDPEDRFEDHVRDTLVAGGELCDAETVEMVVREAPARIAELVTWGTRFDEAAGVLALCREGGHSRERIVHALGDATGKEVMRAVIEYVHLKPNITIWENAFTIDLLTTGTTCHGALVSRGGEAPMLVWAKQTILCTGGAGRVYRETTNPPVATADGFGLAWRAGARMRDMEFMQFHPTVLYIAGGDRFLISEAVRGEGAHLIDATGYRFMPDYDERLELAPRDVVAQAIVQQMEKTQHPCVYLTLSHLDRLRVRERFPGIAAMCRKFEIDITTDRIPVRPGAHYMVGGVTVDRRGRTSIDRLWAAGEVTSSGLHGANRLASNSLLEGLVYGAHAGEGAAEAAAGMRDDYRIEPIESPVAENDYQKLDVGDIRASLRSLMGRAVGVKRSRDSLQAALVTIDHYCGYVLSRQFSTAEGWELQNLLTAARLMTSAALAREESRGVHFRTDFPESRDQLRRHISLCRTANGGKPILDPRVLATADSSSS